MYENYFIDFFTVLSAFFGKASETRKAGKQVRKGGSAKVYKVGPGESDKLKLADHIKEVELICLETSAESALGTIDHVVFDKGKIYIQTLFQRMLLQFSENGKFLRRISNKGRGPEEYTNLKDFHLMNDKIHLLDGEKILEFDTLGNYIGSYKWDRGDISNLYPDRFCFFNEKNYFLWAPSLSANMGSHPLQVLHHVKSGKVEESSYSMNFPGFASHCFYRISDSSYLLRPTTMDQSAYEISENKIEKKYTIDFGPDNVDLEKLEIGFSQKVSERNTKVLKNNDWLQFHFYFSENKDKICFQYSTRETKKGLAWAFIDKATGKSFTNEQLVLDGVLPFSIIGLDYRSNELIGIAYPYKVMEFEGNAESAAGILKEKDLEKLRSLKDTDNPILLKIKTKS
ncbi:MAG: 6-bladed beta-propeller [Cytophagales bacterium]|nr:6-bladed beta-propeller [Cytophagales bacterium]